MTASAIAIPSPSWELQSSVWLTGERVELLFTRADGCDALVSVEVRLDLPRSPSEPAHEEELVVLDVEGAALDAAREVARCRDVILSEFYSDSPWRAKS
jgi:hypothetical protein